MPLGNNNNTMVQSFLELLRLVVVIFMMGMNQYIDNTTENQVFERQDVQLELVRKSLEVLTEEVEEVKEIEEDLLSNE